MSKLTTRLILCVPVLASISGFCLAADAANEHRAAGADFMWTRDSDGFVSKRLSLEFLPNFTNIDNLTGARVSEYQYSQGDWRREGQKISLLSRKIDPATSNGWMLDAGVFKLGDHTTLTLDGSYRMPLTPKTGLEAFISRDWVETPTSLDNGINFTFVGTALDHQFGDHVTVAGVLGEQFFSDGNRRDHQRLKLIYQPSLDLGLTLQARYRTYHSSDDDVGGAYFNPKNYDESMLAFGWRQRFQGWTATLTGGIGREKINDSPRQQTKLAEVGLQSPIRLAQSVRMRAGYNRSASFFGPTYQYRYVQGEWVMRF